MEVSMNNDEFSKMTKAELRAYLVSHPDNQAAFFTFVDRITSEAANEFFPVPQSQTEINEVKQLIQLKLQNYSPA
jgi:hypothetical protein